MNDRAKRICQQFNYRLYLQPEIGRQFASLPVCQSASRQSASRPVAGLLVCSRQ